MNELSPEATYDVLYISSRLQRKVYDFSLYEIQFFSYFSCLLSLYDGTPIDSWSYNYIKADMGMPYSSEIHKTFDHLNAYGLVDELVESRGYFKLTDKGENFLSFYNDNINHTSWRRKYLDAACDSVSLIPFGNVKNALNEEPVLRSAGNSRLKRNLLSETNPSTRALYQQFRALHDAIGDSVGCLIIPAVVWLQALNENPEKLLQR